MIEALTLADVELVAGGTAQGDVPPVTDLWDWLQDIWPVHTPGQGVVPEVSEVVA